MAGKTKEQKAAEEAEEARRAALTQEERDAEDEAAAAAESEAKANDKAGRKSKKTSVMVKYYGGEREFSKEIHGDDFEDTAAEFAETHKGTIL